MKILFPAGTITADRCFLGLFAVAAVLRILLLFGPAVYHHQDEATNGVMALDFLRGGRIPYFQYADDYGGGQVVEALLMVPLFKALGATERVSKMVPAAESLLVLFLIWALLRRWVSPRAANLAFFVLSTAPPFVVSSFMIYGSMATAAAGWGGLLLTLEAARGAALTPRRLFPAGLLLGVAFYLFPSALFYLALALLLLLLLRHRLLLSEVPALAAMGGGFFVGALPLLLARLAYGGGLGLTESALPAFEPTLYTQRVAGFFLHDLPFFFDTALWEFPVTLPIRSWVVFGGTAILAAVALLRAGRPFGKWWSSVKASRPWRPSEEGWAWVWFVSLVLFVLLYSLEPRAGAAARYVIPAFPFFMLLAAWGVLALVRWRARAGWLTLLVVVAIEVPLLVEFARKDTVTDWSITVHGADVHALERFLQAHEYRHVVAPYGIKWKLMFLSEGGIKGAAYLFCMDREYDDNNEVMTRVNSGQAPLVIVLDRDFRWDDTRLTLCPESGFSIRGFLTELDRKGLSYEGTLVGDFVVFHRFSGPVRLPPMSEVDTTGKAIRVIPRDGAQPLGLER